jgi:hypothetical protein
MSRVGRSVCVWRTVAAALLLLALASSQPSHAGNGAIVVDDTDVDPVGHCKVDSWASFGSDRERIGVVSPGCVFDFGHPVDLALGLQPARADGAWGTTAGVKLRTLMVPGGAGAFSVLFSAGSNFDARTGEPSNAFVNIPVTFQAMETLKLNLNAGWLYDQTTRLHWATWGTSVDWCVNNHFSLIGETFGVLGNRDPQRRGITDPRTQLGLRFKPTEDTDIDVIYGRNITGEKARWLTVGLNVRFNAFGPREPAELRRPPIGK